MESGDSMPSSAAPLSRRPAVSGTRSDKDQPAPPPDQSQPTTEGSSAPTPGGRGAPRPPQKAPSRSATIDNSIASMSLASAPKQPAQPCAPPSLISLPVSASLAAAVKRTPANEREAAIQANLQNVFIEELKTKITELEATLQQKEGEIKHQKDIVKHREGEITHLHAKYGYLLSEPYRQEVLSIRRHLQVDDACEPWEINKKFGEIVRKVEDISRDMGDALCSLPHLGKPTTLDLLKFLSRSSEGQALAAATPSADLDIEDFIDFGCRALINETLFNSILSPAVFHPGLRPEDNDFYCDLYGQIRRLEPQVVSGRWRISTYKLHANRTYSPKDQALRLCKEILLPFCSTVVESQPCIDLIESMLPHFEELFKRAYDWNHLAKNSFIMLDFHPQFHPPGSQYENQYTLLEGRKAKPPTSNAILLTSKLGLWSSNAVGGGKSPELSVQTRTTVLAAEYFA
ncbi:unnamed protein product [Rhizoctonia solani]|uniref:Uncharacterized protein n=1 Tax=Rhizoctonia solani TaxID=456999 RepID=A0A8H2Y1Z1_9AGAM|nr:unnamed protein product [Rhizoctonia solani]CAE7125213.1 unnamed protein product [Rhizoctonia solani]